MSDKHVLVCITCDGRVSSSTYDSLYAAKQAKSIALTGMTMEQVVEQQRRRDEDRAKWDSEHPYREPRVKWEREFASGPARWSSGTGGSWQCKDGLIRECYPGDSSMRMISNNEIRQAVVFKDAGDVGVLDRAP